MTNQLLVKAPFKADHVGSFLRPERLKDARALFEQKEISQEQLTQVENEEIIKLIQKQKEAGLLSITDGEFRRRMPANTIVRGLRRR